MIRLVALVCGLLCGFGLIVSGLFRPSLLQNLVNPENARDMTLAIGLLAVLGTSALVVALTRALGRPPLSAQAEQPMNMPPGKAAIGGVIFGLGWGLSGFIPLTALLSIGLFAPGAAIFLVAMGAGMIVHDLVVNRGRIHLDGLRSRG